MDVLEQWVIVSDPANAMCPVVVVPVAKAIAKGLPVLQGPYATAAIAASVLSCAIRKEILRRIRCEKIEAMG